MIKGVTIVTECVSIKDHTRIGFDQCHVSCFVDTHPKQPKCVRVCVIN